MNKIIGILKQKWLVSLVGIIALAIFLWYIGPLLGIAEYKPLLPELNRLLAIGFILLLWCVIQLISFLRARKKNANVMAGMVAEPRMSANEIASKEELGILTERMEEALSELKSTRLGGKSGKQFLYQLPWYIIIGPPGAGKTTLLKNSQLKFPLSERFGNEAIRGVGGTRNCDWWFTEDAVILDTAGRYTTQDSEEEVDKNAWFNFLDLLKSNRGRRPLNGIIVAVSASELLESNEAQRTAHANAIRKRLHELHEQLGMRFPVYFLLTKTDLLSGFSEFFNHLDKTARSQIWGTTFPYSEDANVNSIDSLAEELGLLEDKLHGQLIDRLERERSENKREKIYLFPQQFTLLKNILIDFTREIFQPTRYQHTAMIRGVYLTSATQEGTPIDRIMGSMAQSFGMNQNSLSGRSGQGKSFFINRLLTDLIFSESGLAGTNLKLDNKRAWLLRGSILGILSIFSLITLLLVVSYFKNSSYIDAIDQEAEQLITESKKGKGDVGDILAALPILNQAQSLTGTSHNPEHRVPWFLRFGLSQEDKLGKAGEIIYTKILNQAFLPRLLTRMEAQIFQNRGNSEFLFEALKTYLMFDSNEHFDAETIRSWFSFDWGEASGLPDLTTNSQREELITHLDALLKNRPKTLDRPLNQNLIATTRDILSRAPLADRVYASLKLEIMKTDKPPFSIREAGGQSAPLVFTRSSGAQLNEGIPKLFTYNGYHNTFKAARDSFSTRIAEESWVLGEHQINPTGSELNQLKSDIEHKYATEFVQQWQGFLNDIQIIQFIDLQHSVKTLGILSESESPLKLLLVAAAKETQLDRPQALAPLKDGENPIASAIQINDPISRASEISQQFKPLHKMALSKDDKPVPIDQTISRLNELYNFLLAVEQSGGGTLDAPQQLKAKQLIGALKNDASRKPPLVSALLNKVANNADLITGKGRCASIRSAWQNEVLGFCNSAINNRYPISKRSQTDITNQDFGSLFGPGGKIDSFVNNHLASSIQKTPHRWSWKNTGNSPACVSNSSLDQLKRADFIKQAFFPTGSIPSLNFRIKPLSMSNDILSMTMDIDGQTVSYENQAATYTAIQWPGPNNSGTINLSINPPGYDGNSGFSQSGDWALFRLFDKGSLRRRGRSNSYDLTINSGARTLSFEIQAGSAISPFDLNKLRAFRCPSTL